MMVAVMRPRLLVPFALVVSALLPSAAAFAAAEPTVTLDPACYQSSERGDLTGSGFAPEQHVDREARGRSNARKRSYR